MKIFVELDDFCDVYADSFRRLLMDILRVYPGFKATLFAVPGLTKKNVLRSFWEEYPCLRFAVHGTRHQNSEEWMCGYPQALRMVKEFGRAREDGSSKFLPLFRAGFKAPWLRLSPEAAQALWEYGYWIAGGCKEGKLSGGPVFNYQAGKEIVKGILYERDDAFVWHGHVQAPGIRPPWADCNPALESGSGGIAEILGMFLNRFDKDSEFGYIEELVTKCPD